MAITFQNQQIDFKLKNKSKLKLWIQKTVEAKKKKLGQLTVVFSNDEVLFKANKQFLNHSTYTDIITFDYCEGNKINGDIMISLERVEENAKKFKIDFDNELHRVIIHGVLHLLGYKDKTKKDVLEMRKQENLALTKL